MNNAPAPVTVSPNSGKVTDTGRRGTTVALIAKALDCEYPDASHLVNLAVLFGAAKNIGRHHVPGMPGRPTEVYDFSMEALLTALANRGNIECDVAVTAYEPPAVVQFTPRRRVKTEREVAVLIVAPLGRPASEPLDFDDVGETAPHGVTAPVSSEPSTDTLAALADIALL